MVIKVKYNDSGDMPIHLDSYTYNSPTEQNSWVFLPSDWLQTNEGSMMLISPLLLTWINFNPNIDK